MNYAKRVMINRRDALLGVSALATSVLLPNAISAKQNLIATPKQTAGPFYPVDWKGDSDNDLVIVKGEAAKAMGTVLHLKGRVTDLTGKPLPGASIEIWQCDAKGVYRHPYDVGGNRQRDAAFQGRGRTKTDASGYYTFRTIKPVPYPGRTPHIHFKIEAPGFSPLITQMYIEGEALNKNDFLLNQIRSTERKTVLVSLQAADRIEQDALFGTFDIFLDQSSFR